MRLESSSSVLVVIDIQGKLSRIVHQSELMIKNTSILIQGMKALGVPVLVTEQYPQGIGRTIDEIAVLVQGDPLFEKDSFSCCGLDTFNVALQNLGRKQILLCGIETHVCVFQTAMDLVNAGYEVHLVTDAVSSRTKENRDLAIAKMQSLGVVPTGTEMALFELLKYSNAEKFRTISKLVR